MNPLRIHFFVSFVHPQGTYFRFHNLARGLAALGHDVHVYACDQEADAPARAEQRDGVPYSIVPVSRASRLFTAGADPWRTLTRGLTRFPPCDVAHLFQPFAVSALAWRRCPARIRFWDWDDLWTHDPAPTIRPLRRHWPRTVTASLEHALPRTADHVTAIDHYLLDLARSRGAKASSLLYNPSPSFDAPSRADTRAQFGLDPDAPYVGFMGYTLDELAWCFEAVARNLTRHPRLRFVLCGPPADALPPMRPDVRARTDCLGRLPQSQARALAGAMDLALLPLEDNAFNRSRFPVKFSEYLMAGTPVLCSEIGECGLLAPKIPGILGAGATRESWLDAFDAALDRASAGTLPAVDADAVHALFSSEVVCRGLAAAYESALSPAAPPMSVPTKVYLVCCGLGRTYRGFESFTQECHEALRDHPALDLTVFSGGKTGPKQVVLWCLSRTHPLVERLGRVIGKTGYWLEQVSFALSLLPHVARGKPDVVCFMDCNVGNVLWHWRRLTRRRFGLLLSNGGPLMPPFPRWDFVQQLTPLHLQLALEAGQDPDKQAVVPYGIQTGPCLEQQTHDEHNALRRTLYLPRDRPILLSVGAVNATHKRMDYVVREVAAVPAPRPYLVLLGQTDEETPAIRALADDLLGPDGCTIRTVPHSEVGGYYRSADAFLLASLGEGFGRVFLEAMAAGLPCLAHDYAVPRYVLGEHGLLADLTRTGALTGLLRQLLDAGDTDEAPEARHKHAYERFSWQTLTPHYAALFERGKVL